MSVFASARLRDISIHALLAESDQQQFLCRQRCCNFNPRSPCGERPCRSAFAWFFQKFQSTLSLRRATVPRGCCVTVSVKFQSTLSLRRATLEISLMPTERGEFQSTLSLRRATACVKCFRNRADNFNPRSPCGERPKSGQGIRYPVVISIHALLAESDHDVPQGVPVVVISIHALLAESDPKRLVRFVPSKSISIHALLAESDVTVPCKHASRMISIHALLAESDLS